MITRIDDSKTSVNYQPLILKVSIRSNHPTIHSVSTAASSSQNAPRRFALETEEQLFTDEDEGDENVQSSLNSPSIPQRPEPPIVEQQNLSKDRLTINLGVGKKKRNHSRSSSSSSGLRERVDDFIKTSRKPEPPTLALPVKSNVRRPTPISISGSESGSNSAQSPICIPSSPVPEELERMPSPVPATTAVTNVEIHLQDDCPKMQQSVDETLENVEAQKTTVFNDGADLEASPMAPRNIQDDEEEVDSDQAEESENENDDLDDDSEDEVEVDDTGVASFLTKSDPDAQSEVKFCSPASNSSISEDDGSEAEDSEMDEDEDEEEEEDRDEEDDEDEDQDESEEEEVDEDIITYPVMRPVVFNAEKEKDDEEASNGGQRDNENEDEAVIEKKEEHNNESEEEEVSENSSQIFDLPSTPPPSSQRLKLRTHRNDSVSSDTSDDQPQAKKPRIEEEGQEVSSPSATRDMLASSQPIALSDSPDDEAKSSSTFVPTSQILYEASPELAVYTYKPKKTTTFNTLIPKKFKKPMRDASVQVQTPILTSAAVQAVVEVKDVEMQVSDDKARGGLSRKRTHEIMIATDDIVQPTDREEFTPEEAADKAQRPKKGLPWRAVARYTTVFALGALAAVLGLASIPDVD